jgi:hypothetical protein
MEQKNMCMYEIPIIMVNPHAWHLELKKSQHIFVAGEHKVCSFSQKHLKHLSNIIIGS